MSDPNANFIKLKRHSEKLVNHIQWFMSQLQRDYNLPESIRSGMRASDEWHILEMLQRHGRLTHEANEGIAQARFFKETPENVPHLEELTAAEMILKRCDRTLDGVINEFRKLLGSWGAPTELPTSITNALLKNKAEKLYQYITCGFTSHLSSHYEIPTPFRAKMKKDLDTCLAGMYREHKTLSTYVQEGIAKQIYLAPTLSQAMARGTNKTLQTQKLQRKDLEEAAHWLKKCPAVLEVATEELQKLYEHWGL